MKRSNITASPSELKFRLATDFGEELKLAIGLPGELVAQRGD